ncbi:MAG: hypothetical protein L0241_27325 [Planctomycetia bacterium]|nr:hypothetical protein [Planctomycetia bacterium]
MNKWTIGAGAAVAALAGCVAAVFLIGSDRPNDPASLPGIAVPEASAQPALPAPAVRAKGLYLIDEKMPFRKAMWKEKWGNEEREVEVLVSARRRLTPNGPVYFVRILFPGIVPILGPDQFMIEVSIDDAVAIADFLENPMGALPPAAKKGEKALIYRTLLVSGCFDRDDLTLEYDPAADKFSSANIAYAGDNKHFNLYLNRKRITDTIRESLQDFDTLKTYPAKR